MLLNIKSSNKKKIDAFFWGQKISYFSEAKKSADHQWK
jgi:hypothetical protein